MMPTSRRPPRAMRISRLSPHLSPLAPTRSPLFQLYTLIATSRRPRHVELVTVVGLGAVLPVHGAATEAQHRRPFRRVVVHRGKQVAQQRAVDAVVPRARARARARRERLHHMSHVTTKSCSWSRCSLPSVTYALAHVTSTLKLRGHTPPCGGGTQRIIGLRKAAKKASL